MPSQQHAPRNPSAIDIHIGERLRIRRKVVRLSQTDLGEKLGVTFQQVQKYEKGSNRMGGSRIYQAAQALGVEPSYFFEGLDNKIAPEMQTRDDADMNAFIQSTDGLEFARALAPLAKTQRNAILAMVRAIEPQK